MRTKRRVLLRILIAASAFGAIAFAVVLGIALSELSDGPSLAGYDMLNVAMQSLPYLAGLVAATVIVASIGRRIRFAVGGLALASGVLGGIATGLATLGLTLARIDSIHQPPALNSLVLAIYGVGTQIVPAAVVLVVGAVALAMGTTIARRATAGAIAAPAAA